MSLGRLYFLVRVLHAHVLGQLVHLQILEMPLIFIVIGFVVPVFATLVILICFVDVL